MNEALQVARNQFLVGRLQLLLSGLKFFIRRLEFLVSGQQFFLSRFGGLPSAGLVAVG